MKNRSTPNADLIETFDDDQYDVEAMKTDDAHNNFSPDRADEYTHEYIVAESIANGQFEQARTHCQRHGLIYEQEMIRNGRDPWK